MSDSVTQGEPVIEFVDLAKEFRLGLQLTRVQAVRGVTLEVTAGEIFGYLGPNGAGKTTTMKMAMALIQPTAGEVKLFGRSIEEPSVRARVGYLPEHPYFYDYLTASEILDFYGQLYGMGRKERARRVGELLELVGLTHAANRTLRRFSKGMLQRVGIAQAIINDPDLVILDEPLSGLDPMGRKEVRDIIVSLREQGKTVFFSSHILHDIETICDRVGLLIHGRLQRVGPLETLLSGGTGQVDITARDVPEDSAGTLEQLSVSVERLGPTTVFTVEDTRSDALLGELLAAGAHVHEVQPRRQSLEALFVHEAEVSRDG
ncbi:MAG: ABC transporter ATP-binding protein [Myxococcota bacterium]|nr:ABC transporter ATP-binding protein [Myxococcota bacterium]